MTILTLSDIDLIVKKKVHREASRLGVLEKKILVKKKEESFPGHGRDILLEASFEGLTGQAFCQQGLGRELKVRDLIRMPLENKSDRAIFYAAVNAFFKRCQYCHNTLHCRQGDQQKCSAAILDKIQSDAKVLLIGFQTCLLEHLSKRQQVRIIDPSAQNVWEEFWGVRVEHPNNTKSALGWCDTVLVTGSTIVDGTITTYLNWPKPVTFFGVTISAAAKILGFNAHCAYGY